MKPLSQQKAIERLDKVISDLKSEISNKYEHRAKSCMTCDTQGACCLDEHFVNVHISRLDAVVIQNSLNQLPKENQHKIKSRIDAAIEKYDLTTEGDTYAQTYACPLFENGIGCLVHKKGKPVACIIHACYERQADLPPDELQTAAEKRLDELNVRVFGRSLPLLPLPLALRRQINLADAE